MKTYENIFINGSWVKPQESNEYIDVINPANEEIIAKYEDRENLTDSQKIILQKMKS